MVSAYTIVTMEPRIASYFPAEAGILVVFTSDVTMSDCLVVICLSKFDNVSPSPTPIAWFINVVSVNRHVYDLSFQEK